MQREYWTGKTTIAGQDKFPFSLDRIELDTH